MKCRIISILLPLLLFSVLSCRNGSDKNTGNLVKADRPIDSAGLVMIGRDIITEVILRPDTLGDPWEVEKVKGFSGDQMFTTLFERIYDKKLTVFDCLTGEALNPADIKKMEKEFNSDRSRIAKMQFVENWYFDPATNEIVKKTRSVSFGYEIIREGGLPAGYAALFRVKSEQTP